MYCIEGPDHKKRALKTLVGTKFFIVLHLNNKPLLINPFSLLHLVLSTNVKLTQSGNNVINVK